MITITIPGTLPPSPNELRRKFRNPHAYARLRESWKKSIFVLTPYPERKQLEEWAKGKMQFCMTVWSPREYDPDNLAGSQKPILDALKLLGWIHDDSSEWLLLSPAKWQRSPKKFIKTEICLGPEPVSSAVAPNS